MERCDLDGRLLYFTLNTLGPVYPPVRVSKQRRREAASVQATSSCAHESAGTFFFFPQVSAFLYWNTLHPYTVVGVLEMHLATYFPLA